MTIRLRGYSFDLLSADLVAGLVTGVLMVPQAMAYALLAGLPPATGLYSCMVAPLVYAGIGTSRPLSVGPVAVVSLMTSAALAPLFAAGSADYAQAAIVVALLSGAMLLVLGILRLGILVNFLSYPVVAGFTMGAAILIILSQTPQIMGIKLKEAGNAGLQLLAIFGVAGQARAVTVVIGLASAFLLIAARGPLAGWLRRLGAPPLLALGLARTMPLTVVVIASLSSGWWRLGEQGIALVGPLAQGFPRPQFTLPTLAELRLLAGPAALIALIGYLESVSIAQILARRRRERIVANHELVGLGLANLAVGIFQGMPVAGSISRSAESDMAGARTRAAGIFAAALVMLVPLTLSGFLAQLPRAVLAAIIISAVLRLLDWRMLLRTWRYDRADGIAWAATTLGVLVIGVEAGLMAGLALSLLLYIWRTANPHLTEVGRLPYSDTFVDLKRHHEAETWPQIALIRIDESLFFGNASAIETYVLERVADRPEVTDLILIGSAVNSVDSSALAMLEDLDETLQRSGLRLHLAEVKGPVLDRLAGSVLLARLGRERIHVSAASAVVSLASPPI